MVKEEKADPVKKPAQFVRDALPDEVDIMQLDSQYWLYPKDQFYIFLMENKIDEKDYRSDRYDCENFSFSLKAAADENISNQVGLVVDYEAGHSYNVVVWPDGEWNVLEPQSDTFVKNYNRGNYKFTKGHTVVLI